MKPLPRYRLAIWTLPDIRPPALGAGRWWTSSNAEVYALPAAPAPQLMDCLHALAPNAVLLYRENDHVALPSPALLATLKRRLPLSWLLLGVVSEAAAGRQVLARTALDAVVRHAQALPGLLASLAAGRPLSGESGVLTRAQVATALPCVPHSTGVGPH